MTLKPSYHLLLYYWYIGMRSPRTIARKTGIALSTVTYNIKKLRQQRSLLHRGKNGRHSRITAEAARAIGKYIWSNCELTAGQIAMKLETEKALRCPSGLCRDIWEMPVIAMCCQSISLWWQRSTVSEDWSGPMLTQTTTGAKRYFLMKHASSCSATLCVFGRKIHRLRWNGFPKTDRRLWCGVQSVQTGRLGFACSRGSWMQSCILTF